MVDIIFEYLYIRVNNYLFIIIILREAFLNKLNHGDYVTNGFKGNGRGFGDVDISANLRYGQDARNERKTARTQDLKDYRFHHMFKGFHDENNTVLPFSRGGIDTRNLDKYRNKN